MVNHGMPHMVSVILSCTATTASAPPWTWPMAESYQSMKSSPGSVVMPMKATNAAMFASQAPRPRTYAATMKAGTIQNA